jgi:tRNA-dihydrouridine synthase B
MRRTAPPLPAPPLWPAPLRLEGHGIHRSLGCRVLQSPMAGVSDHIFRGLVRRWAPEALLFTEMVHAGHLSRGQGGNRLQALQEEIGPIGVQLFDHRPEAMAEAARRAEGAGAFLIDINMGCPVPKVARKGGGSGLIRDPELATRLVEAVAAAVALPVTVKTRLTWHGVDPDDARTAAAIAWCRRLREAGAQLLTLHGRSREQGFGGQADWSAIAAVKRAVPLPLIANGDIRSPAEALRCLAITGADGVMVGRGSLGAPWLVGQIAATLAGLPPPATPLPEERLALAAEHLQALLAEKGDHGLLVARKHLGWACGGLPGAADLRQALLRAPTPKEALALLGEARDRLQREARAHGSTSGQL